VIKILVCVYSVIEIKETSIFSNDPHLEWDVRHKLKRDHPRTIPVKFGLRRV
jgi:hypothetical protein